MALQSSPVIATATPKSLPTSDPHQATTHGSGKRSEPGSRSRSFQPQDGDSSTFLIGSRSGNASGGLSREDLVDTPSPGDDSPVIQMPPEMQPPTQMLERGTTIQPAFMLVNTGVCQSGRVIMERRRPTAGMGITAARRLLRSVIAAWWCGGVCCGPIELC